MVEAGIGGLDTPRTNIGDATYLSNHHHEFDISQEQSFQSPSKDNKNLINQLRNARRGGRDLRTPRSRVVLGDRKNFSVALGGGEFTPLLKNATRNSGLRIGKENVVQTPAFLKLGGLDNIPEDLSPIPAGSSAYEDSRNASYVDRTSVPQIDNSSTASTPMALHSRQTEGLGALQDGNQLSLREQENIIDKVEKENFGLKLQIHFLQEALRKAGPGYNEAALKENTDLKVDKITMQKELLRYRKNLTAAEQDVELYRQQMLELEENLKQKYTDDGQREKLNRLQQAFDEKETELDRLRSQQRDFEDLQDKVHELEADLRERDRQLDERDDEIENLQQKGHKRDAEILKHKNAVKHVQQQVLEQEEKALVSEELERGLKRMAAEMEELQKELHDALKEKECAEADLEELRDEMANKSISTKGLSRQIEEKATRLQDELEDVREKYALLEEEHADKAHELLQLQEAVNHMKQESLAREEMLKKSLKVIENERDAAIQQQESLSNQADSTQKDICNILNENKSLQNRYDALTNESSSLQRDLERSRKQINELEDRLLSQKNSTLQNEQELRDEFKSAIDRLNDQAEDLRAMLREKDRLYDNDCDKWVNERRNLESQKKMAEEKVVGLQRTVDKLQEAEGAISSKETKLQQALRFEKERHQEQEASLNRQISELHGDVQSRQQSLDGVRLELTLVREELRLSQREQGILAEKAECLEDEVAVLETDLDEETEKHKAQLTFFKKESESLRKEVQALTLNLANTESAASDARAEAEEVRSDLQAGEGSKDQLSSRLRDIEEQLARVRLEKNGLQDQLSRINIEVNSLRLSKADLEAENEYIKNQLEAAQGQEETFRLDQERIDLRSAKMKLENEVRRLREENKISSTERQALEKELSGEIDRANAEEIRLTTEISDLQRILRGSSEKRELATAKCSIQKLESRIRELESQVAAGIDGDDVSNEISIIRRDLKVAHDKETEYVQREAAQREVLRGLKRQISELERKAHDAELSRLISNSPPSSVSGSVRKSEIVEVRGQLASAHQSLKEIHIKLKDVKREANKKITAAHVDAQARSQEWEAEKDELERALDQAQFAKEKLEAQKNAGEAMATRLHAKISNLQQALQAERLKNNEDCTIALERKDLHDMLRESQIQAEELELLVQERDGKIATVEASEASLKVQLQRVRDERNKIRATARDQLEVLHRKHRQAKDRWEAERKQLKHGVRFANTSVSVTDESQHLQKLRSEFETREKHHLKEIRGMSLQKEFLEAKCERISFFLIEAAWAKRYMALQIALFNACNEADIQLLMSKGIKRPPPRPKKPISIKRVGIMLRFIARMKKGARDWAEKRKIEDRIKAQIEKQWKQMHQDMLVKELTAAMNPSAGTKVDMCKSVIGDMIESGTRSRHKMLEEHVAGVSY